MFFFASGYTTGVLFSCPLLCRAFSLMVGVAIAPNRSLSADISYIRSPRVTDTSFVFVSYLLYRLYSTESSQFFSPDATMIWARETKSFLSTLFIHRFPALLSSCAAPVEFGVISFGRLSSCFQLMYCFYPPVFDLHDQSLVAHGLQTFPRFCKWKKR